MQVSIRLVRGLLSAPLLIALLLSGCTKENPELLLNSAKEYLAKKDTAAAIVQLKTVLQKQPDMPEARFLLGRTLLERGDTVGAEVELQKARELRYPDAQVLPPLVKALTLEGKALRAIQDYGSVDLADPAAMAELKVALAGAYAQQGESMKAQLALDQALLSSKDFPPALLMQAKLRAAAGNLPGALELLDRVIASNPGNYEALQFKGDILFFSGGNSAGALEAQKKALALREDWLPSHSSIIEMMMSRRDVEGAKAQLGELKRVLPNHPQTKYFEAQLAFLEKDYSRARELVQVLLRAAPENVRVLLLAGGIEFQSGSVGQAESLVSKALQLAPDSVVVRRLLSQIYLRSGQPEKATETLSPLIEKPNTDAETLALSGQAALQNGEPARAEGLFARAAKLNPNDTRVNTALALAQFAKGKPDLAFAQLQSIASADKGTVADIALISARMRQRNYDAALAAIAILERKQPDKPLAAQLRAQVQFARNDFAGARASLQKALSIDPSYFPAAAALSELDLRDKKPVDARKHFDQLLAADPRNLRALLAIASLRAKAGASNEEVAGLLANASKLNPTVATPRLLLIDLRLRMKDTKSALATAQEGAAALPQSPEMLDALGRTQLASGDTNQALSSFKKMADMQRKSPQPHLRLADTYMAMKDATAARQELNRALELAPKFLPAQRALLMLELSARRPDKAMELAQLVQSERPDQSVGYQYAGEVEMFRRNWDAAATAFRMGLKRGESTELTTRLHAALSSARKDAEADALATRWMKDHPNDIAFRIYLGDRAISQGDWTKAEGHYQAVEKLQPENAITLNNLAWISHRLGRANALPLAEKANLISPGQPAFMDTLATILSESGQVARALELEKRAIEVSPDYHIARLNLAKLYIKAGDKTMARRELELLAKVGEKFSNHAEVAQLLSSI